MSASDNLTLRFADLARANRDGWAECVKALRAFTDARVDQFVASPPDTLPRAQGHAQACREILGIAEDCIRAADKLGQRRSAPK